MNLVSLVEITFDPIQALLGLLALAGVVFVIFLIIFMVRLIGTMKRIAVLLDDVSDPVVESMGQLPEVMKNFDRISGDVSTLTEAARETVPAILKDAQTMTGTARAGVEAVGTAAGQVGDSVSSFFGSARDSASTFGFISQIVAEIFGLIGLFRGRNTKTRRPKRRHGRK